MTTKSECEQKRIPIADINPLIQSDVRDTIGHACAILDALTLLDVTDDVPRKTFNWGLDMILDTVSSALRMHSKHGERLPEYVTFVEDEDASAPKLVRGAS